jgi:two-component system sensor histidine kinase BaeS
VDREILAPGITGKLFLAIFATCIVLLISMHWAVRISLNAGLSTISSAAMSSGLTMLSDALSEQYAQHGSWAFLRNNDRFIFQLLRTFERDNDDRSPPGHEAGRRPGRAAAGWPPDGPRPRPPPHGWRTMFWVVDQSGACWWARASACRRTAPSAALWSTAWRWAGDRLAGGAPDAQYRY